MTPDWTFTIEARDSGAPRTVRIDPPRGTRLSPAEWRMLHTIRAKSTDLREFDELHDYAESVGIRDHHKYHHIFRNIASTALPDLKIPYHKRAHIRKMMRKTRYARKMERIMKS